MAGKSRLQSRDKGYEKLLAAAKAAARGASVTVGVHASEGAEIQKSAAALVTRDDAGRARLNGKFITNDRAAELTKKARGSTPVTIADVAYWNEFGIGVPERSFIRAWFDEATAENRAALRRALTMVLKGEKTIEEALTLVGIRFVGKIQQRISQGIEPANAPATIKAKGSSTPLIDTGQLRQSLTFLVTSGGSSKG
jgi:hypothetical protein